MGHLYNRSVFTQKPENHYRSTASSFCTHLPSPPKEGSAAAGNYAHEMQIHPRELCALPKLQWEEQGGISKPSAFPDCSSKCCLFYTTCSLQRCGTIHTFDLWSHLGCSIPHCHHSDHLLETIQSISPNLYAFLFFIA